MSGGGSARRAEVGGGPLAGSGGNLCAPSVLKIIYVYHALLARATIRKTTNPIESSLVDPYIQFSSVADTTFFGWSQCQTFDSAPAFTFGGKQFTSLF